jgi:hypothetical protein
MVGLDADEILTVARASTGLDDLGVADWPGWDETYRPLLDSIDRESALHPLPVSSDPVADRERRRDLSECEQEFWSDVHPEFMTMHELASGLPGECVHFLAYEFASPHWSMLLDTPSFTGWQLGRLSGGKAQREAR